MIPQQLSRGLMYLVSQRVVFCLFSMVFAAGLLAIFDGGRSAAKQLHIYYSGVLSVFFIVYLIVMLTISQTKISQSYRLIFVTAILAYPVATFSYVIYFIIVDTNMFV